MEVKCSRMITRRHSPGNWKIDLEYECIKWLRVQDARKQHFMYTIEMNCHKYSPQAGSAILDFSVAS